MATVLVLVAIVVAVSAFATGAGARPSHSTRVVQTPATSTTLAPDEATTEPVASSGSDAAVLGIGVVIVTGIGIAVVARQRRRER